MVEQMTGSEVREAPLAMLVLQLEAARREHARLKQVLAERREEFERENSSLISIEGNARGEARDLEAHIRERVALEFDGNKDPAPGVRIRLLKGFQYDESEAFTWAQEHKLALKLDARAFEKHMDAEAHLPGFVQTVETPQVRIDTDLSYAAIEIAARKEM